MRTNVSWKPVALLLLLTGAATGSAGSPAVDPRAWTELDIVPMPKEIRLTDDDLLLDPARVALVIGAGAGRQSQIGAEWINRRLAEVGGTAELSILSGTEIPSAKTALIIGTVDDNPLVAKAARAGIVNVGPENPGERGYEIRRSSNGRRIYLAGADPIGALYACVTFGELLERREEDVFWRAAEVRDWPDILYVDLGNGNTSGDRLREHFLLTGFMFNRIASEPPSAELRRQYLEVMQDTLNWLMRRKVSSFRYEMVRYERMRHVPPESLALIREGIAYGRERGIGALNTGEYPFVALKEDHPGVESELSVPWGRHAENWIRGWAPRFDALRRETARETARLLAAAGFTDVRFHDTDTGGYTNPAQWEERDGESRARWGDDYAAATAHKLGIYHQALRAADPDLRMHYVFYPYSLRILDPEAGERPEVRERIMGIWRSLGQHVPDDVRFVLRETTPENLRAFRELWPHGVMIANYLGNRGWVTFVNEESSFLREYVRDRRDYMRVQIMNEYYVPLRGLAALEYSWNLDIPGGQPWRLVGAREAAACAREEDIFRFVYPRIVRNLFGRETAPDVLEAVLLNLAPNQVFDDQDRHWINLLDTAEKMQEQAARAARGAAALDRAWERLQAGGHESMDRRGRHFLAYLREIFHNTAWTARIRACKLRAREMAREQDLAGARQALDEGETLIEQAGPALRKILEQRPSDMIVPEQRRYMIDGSGARFGMHRLDLPALSERIVNTRAELPELARPIPDGVLARLRADRVLRAVRSRAAIDIRAGLSAPAWDKAWPVETFLDHGERNVPVTGEPARAFTRARLLYDDAFLYVGFECRPPGALAPGEPEPSWEQVEVLIQPGARRPGTQAPYIHFIVTMAGDVRQQALRPFDPQDARAGQWERDGAWRSAGLDTAVAVHDDRWTAVLKIPLEDAAPSRSGTVAMATLSRSAARAGGREWSSTLKPGSDNNHDLRGFRELVFMEEAYSADNVQIDVHGLRLEPATLPEGIVTEAHFALALRAPQVLHRAVCRAEAYGPGGTLEWKDTLARQDRVYYRWTLPQGRARFNQIHPQGGIRITVHSEEGHFDRWIGFGGWTGQAENAALFGRDNAGAYLRRPAWIPSRMDAAGAGGETHLLDSRQGTIEFFLKPGWDIPWPEPGRRSEYRQATRIILHYGADPSGRGNVFNRENLSLRFDDASGRLLFSIADRRYVQWSVSAETAHDRNWRRDAWRHVALVWEAGAMDRERLRIYLDGTLASGNVAIGNRDRLGEDDAPHVPVVHFWPLQIGCAGDGRHPADLGLAGLRISRHARYREDFNPPARPLETDPDTAAHYSLDNHGEGAGSTAPEAPSPRPLIPGIAGWP